MAVKNKSTKRDLNNEKITLYFRTNNVPNDKCNDGNFEDDDQDWIYKWGMKYNNITANKATYVSDDYRWFSIFTLGVADFGIGDMILNKNGQADNCGTYEPVTFYPTTGPVLSGVTPVPVKRPKNKLYPALLDFEEIGYTSIISGLKNLKTKKNVEFFSTVFKPTLIQYAGFRGPILAKQDKYALDINDLKIYNTETGQEDRTGNSLDEEIFVPINEWMYSASMYNNGNVSDIIRIIYEWICSIFGKDSEIAKRFYANTYDAFPDIPLSKRTDRIRKWANWKYFASHTKTEFYTENKPKYDNYINSLIKDNEELISFKEIIYGDTPEEDYIRYILQTCIGEEFYDYNDNLVFIVNGIKYCIDFENEQFINKDTNEYITNIYCKQDTVFAVDNYSYKNYLNNIIQDTHLDLVNEIKDVLNEEYRLNHKLQASKFNDLSYKQYDIKTEIDRQNKLDAILKDYDFIYKSSVLTVRTGTVIDNVTLDKKNNFKETIYLLEKNYLSNDYDKDHIDTITVEPIVIFDGVTNKAKYSIRKNTSTYKKIYPDFTDMLNYKQLLDEEDEVTGEIKKYTYENRTTKRPIAKTIQNSWLKIDNEGNITTVDKEDWYDKTPIGEILVNQEIEDTVKFTLPNITINNDMRVLKYIYNFKRNLIDGFFIKYRDKNDGKIKIRLYNEDAISFSRNTCDVHPSQFDVLPLVPFYSVLDVTVPILVESRGLDMHFGALASSSAFRYYYFTYNKKVNQYYKHTLNWPLLGWDRHINGYYNDTEYKIKTPKKVSKLYTNEKLLMYNPSFLKNPEMDDEAKAQARSSLTDYDTFYSKAPYGCYGTHTSIRFTFAIFFNRLIRKTKLLNKMAVKFLEFYYKQYSKGNYGIPVSVYVYPNDRIQFSEKRLHLYFVKTQISDDEVSSLKASYYSELDYYNGFLTFYNRNKREKYVLYINKLYPNWKATFFDNQSTTLVKKKYSDYTITLSDIIPLSYIDTIVATGDNVPTTKYTAVKNKKNYYQYTVKSYYYNTSTDVTYKTKTSTKTRTIDMWGSMNVDEYCCFYTPQNTETFNTNEDYISDIFNNFEERNIATALFNFFDILTEEELTIYYKKIFGENAELPVNAFEEDINIFNHNNMFTDDESIVKLSTTESKLSFKNWTEDSVDVVNYTINTFQPWADFRKDTGDDSYANKMPELYPFFWDKNGDIWANHYFGYYAQDLVSYDIKTKYFDEMKTWFKDRMQAINPDNVYVYYPELKRDTYPKAGVKGYLHPEYGGYGTLAKFVFMKFTTNSINISGINTKEWLNTFCPKINRTEKNIWQGDVIQDGWIEWTYRQYMTNNISLAQSRDLYLDYSYSNVYNGSKQVKETYINKMVDKLLYEAFPSSKIIKTEEFEKYFVDLEEDNILLSIFTAEEIYDFGFNNFLVTNDIDDPNDKTVVLAKIYNKLQNSLISDGNNGANINNFWMAIPVKAYNSFPFYAKVFCTRWFFCCESYLVRHYPEFNKTVYNKNQSYTIGLGVLRVVVLLVVTIILLIYCPPAAPAAMVAMGFAIASMIMTIVTLILQILAAAYIGTAFGKTCKKLAKITAIISVVLGVVGAVIGGASAAAGAGASSAATATSTLTTTLNIVNLCVTIVNVVMTIVNISLKAYYQKKVNKQTERVNEKIDEYNESINEVYNFLEENEDKMNLDIVNPSTLITEQDHNIDTNIDRFFDNYNNDSLEYLYAYVDDYYDNSLVS